MTFTERKVTIKGESLCTSNPSLGILKGESLSLAAPSAMEHAHQCRLGHRLKIDTGFD
jgi:hypothetical protein